MPKELEIRNQKYAHQQCFVGHSHKAPWRDDIIGACEETLPKFGLQPWYADDQFEPTKSLRDKVVEMVANARYGIYDLSWWPDEQSAWKMPQNVLIELGMAIALNRPVLLLRHAGNRASGLSLPTCLDSISQRIVEFSGGPTLKRALEERLPQWLNVPPDRAWWARYCLFGERTCIYRETYPQIIQCGQKTIGCHIADGQDIDRPDFRSLIEDELGRYSDISFEYLDALLPTAGYDFQLCTYCQTVRSTPFAIYRITPETTAETFIAIGMSIALEKQFKCEIPKFIFTTDARSVPSLLTGYEVVETKTTKEQQKRLQKFIPVVIRKVRESAWKPESLPFMDFSLYTDEISLSEKNLSHRREDINESDLSQDKDVTEVKEENTTDRVEDEVRRPAPPNLHISAARGHLADGHIESAYVEVQKAYTLEPNNPLVHKIFGQVFARRVPAQSELAIRAYMRSLELKRDDAETHKLIGDVSLYLTQQPLQAIPAYIESLRLNANDFETHLRLGQCYEETDQLDFALREYQEAARLAPEQPPHPEVHFFLGKMAMHLKKLRIAERAFVQILFINPADHQTRFLLSQVYEGENELEKAYRQCNYVIEPLAANPEVKQMLERLKASLGR